VHGIIDYAYVAAVSVLPEVAGFSDNKKATLLCRALSGNVLATTALTRAEWGVIKLIPFKGHLLADIAVSLFALNAPWLLKFAGNKRAKYSLIGVGVLGLMAVLLSRPEEMNEQKL
jgi:hypothetical protein